MNHLLNWLLPAQCLLCRGATDNSTLCLQCYADLPWQREVCRMCAHPLSGSDLCGRCLQDPPPYDHTVCLLQYQPPIDHFVLALKHAGQLNYARLLAELLMRDLREYYRDRDHPTCLIPMPLHRQRLQQRGYNQAVEIARLLCRKMAVAMDVNSCARVIETAPQASIPAEERRKNLRNAFRIAPDFPHKYVAIFDDVVTTGSTVSELARALKSVGVRKIAVWCCARTALRY